MVIADRLSSTLTRRLVSMMVRYPLVTIAAALTCTHGVLFGMILGTVAAFTSSVNDFGWDLFVDGFLLGVFIEAAVASSYMFLHRKTFSSLQLPDEPPIEQ